MYTSIANVEKAASVLSSLNPENVLQRGYSITHNAQGKILKSVDQIQLNDEVAVRLWKGKFSSRVMRKTL